MPVILLYFSVVQIGKLQVIYAERLHGNFQVNLHAIAGALQTACRNDKKYCAVQVSVP